MESVLVKIDSKKEFRFFIEFIKKMGYQSKVLSGEEKEDIALLKMMALRKKEETLPVKTTHRILDKLI